MTIKDPKIAMTNAALLALDYIKTKNVYEPEEVIKHVMKVSEASPSTKLGALAAANEVIKLKKNNPSFTDKQIMQMLMNNLQNISNRLAEE